MVDDKQKLYHRLYIIVDLLVLAVSYLLAWFLYVQLPDFRALGERGILPPKMYLTVMFLIMPIYLALYYAFNLYVSKRLMGRRLELANILKANAVGLLLVLAFLYLAHQVHYSRGMLFLFAALNVAGDTITRNVIHMALNRLWRSGFNQKQILMVGYSKATEQYIDRIRANPEWGYQVRGILDDEVKAGTMYKDVKVLGRIANLDVILPQNHLDEIAITLGLKEYNRLEEIVAICEKSGVHTQFVPDYQNIIPTKPYTQDLQGLPVVNIRYVPLNNSFHAFTKRAVDIFGAIVAILLFSPVMLFSVIMIKLTSPGPLIYKQERVGLHNKPFSMYKFRSMEVQPEEQEKKAWTVRNDPRVTEYGKFMRHTSVDELPQLFNILKGDMSLVGPRPERPFFVEKFREEIPRYMIKHQVRPGLTGWAQVNGYRGDTSIRKRIDCDLYYIENWSLGLDFKIIFLTFFKGFINKNAY